MDTKKLVILIFPSTGQDIRISISPPHSLLSIAADILPDYNVILIDQRITKSWRKRLVHLINQNPICVGISSMIGTQLKNALEAAKLIRHTDPTIPIVWGGVHTTLTPEMSIQNPFVDYIILGEGEGKFRKLLQFFEQNIPTLLKKIDGICYQQSGQPLIQPEKNLINLDDLNEIPWHLVDVEKYIHKGEIIESGLSRTLDIGSSTRGCPWGCGFCYHNAFDSRKWRAMNVEKTVDLFIDNIKKFNLDGVWLRDDNFYVDINRVGKFAKNLQLKLRENKLEIFWYTSGIDFKSFMKLSSNHLMELKRTGCTSQRFGIESGSNRILKYINKPFTVEDVIAGNERNKKFNITPHYTFMGGFPTETLDEVFKTVDFMDYLQTQNPDAKIHQFSIFNPIPGTPLFYQAIEHGFQPYQSLEEYAQKSHFFSKNLERFHHIQVDNSILNNISDLSYLTSVYFEFGFNPIFQPLMKLVKKYFKATWKKRMFKHRIDLVAYRKLRNAIFHI